MDVKKVHMYLNNTGFKGKENLEQALLQNLLDKTPDYMTAYRPRLIPYLQRIARTELLSRKRKCRVN